MRDPNELRHEIETSQGDLEAKVSELKQLVEHELEVPRKVVAETAHVVEYLRAHWRAVAIAGVAVLGALVVSRRRRRAS